MTQTQAIEGPTSEQQIRAKKMLLTVGLFSIVMMFAAFSSAYIVIRNSTSYWVNISMPQEFFTSTILILLSSVTIFFANRFLKKGNNSLAIGLTALTLVLGSMFCFQQYQGFQKLADLNMTLTGNSLMNIKGVYGQDYVITTSEGETLSMINGDYFKPGESDPVTNDVHGMHNGAASYFNGLVILHVLHVAVGILFLLLLVIWLLIKTVNKDRPLWMQQVARYWHFVDGLWLYLFLFLYLIH
ncbi:MAG: hypothetical protein HKN39_01815 [Flavobacteriales bacterium]|nr:hypothetical protein [Flavobacteriales bacterium]